MRILICNDDGVFAPGIAALARGLESSLGDGHELTVVAPLTDHSGASAAVGAVYGRESIPFEQVELAGLPDVPVFGIDGPPAMAAILACIEAFGPRPDLVVSGVNHGINAGRSVMHSGTVGAALTAAQFGVPGLAVSIAWSDGPVPWETPVSLACRIVPTVMSLPPATVLNLNTPAVPIEELRGLRQAGIGTSGLIRSVRTDGVAPPSRANDGAASGVVTLALRGGGTAEDRKAERSELDEDSDAALLADGWATLTAVAGVREDVSERGRSALQAALATFSPSPVPVRHPRTLTGRSRSDV